MQETTDPTGDQAAIAARVRRLSRPHSSGGAVIERSVILAEGAGALAMLAWIEDHDGVGDSTAVGARAGGLHGARMTESREGPAKRFVLPADAFKGVPS
jgi:hypothetical protein